MNGHAKPAAAPSAEDATDVDVQELLKDIEAANEVADGMESRLDSLLGTLDSLLAKLEDAEQQRNNKKDEKS
ncbi:hypothetical protein EXIGLDRAFT_725898 [Exidia glandulosa HHB12029]|uniref:Uncharacterized protein n=1 Tax=Exidia glandulosa HHB12029 TaxID=1314781 RepID=A0A166B9Z2_EXIGL|nr:hypothetical protein EXIGLDRAFT_725898 [Exidia glandulosa HHB12029]